MIVISDDVVLTAAEQADGITGDNPRIGWHNIVPAGAIAASDDDDAFPVSNLLRPETFLKWKGGNIGEHTITVTATPAESVNYFAIAGHNFATAGAGLKLQQSPDGITWTDLTDEFLPATDHALMVEFADTQASQYYRLVVAPTVAIPEIGALNIGRVLRMQRRLYVGHKPMGLNRKTETSTGFSESGQFLGRTRLRQMLEGSAEFANITPDWVRAYFDDFQDAAETLPFFFAWRPEAYPDEIAYVSLTGDPDIVNQQANGMVGISMSMRGIR